MNNQILSAENVQRMYLWGISSKYSSKLPKCTVSENKTHKMRVLKSRWEKSREDDKLPQPKPNAKIC